MTLVEQRMQRLERQNRGMRRIGGVAVAVAATVFLIGQGKDKDLPDLEVRSLILKDRDGKNRALLRMNDLGSPTLSLFDRHGKNRALLGLNPDGLPALLLSDRNEKVRVLLSMNRDGAPGLRFLDDSGTDRAALVAADAASALNLCDKDGRQRAVLNVGWNGTAALALKDSNGNDQAVLGSVTALNRHTGARTTTAPNTLTLFDTKGNCVWQAPPAR